MLVVTSPSDDNAGLVRRSSGGVDSTIVAPNANLSLGTIEGIGANPHMNANGVAAFQIQFDSASTNTAIYTGTPGSIQLIADTGDVLSGGTVCSIEPFPLINASNQVFFGTSLIIGTCGASEDEGLKAIYRFTPPATIDRLLLAAADGSGDQIVISDTDFVTSPTTFVITDAHMINYGGDAAGSNGGLMVTAAIRPQSSADTCVNWGDGVCERVLLYLGPTPGTIQLIAAEGADSIFDGQKLKGVANNVGAALFKAQGDDIASTAGAASVQLWTSGGGPQEIEGAGDPVPGATTGTFNGFTSHLDLNDNGNAAFTAGLNLGTEGDPCAAGDICRGVYYKPSGGAVVEIARSTAAAAIEAGAPDSLNGFDFEEISSVAIVDSCDTVYFVAENNDTGGQTCGSTGLSQGDGEFTGVFAWNNGTLTKVLTEGDTVTDGRVMRLFVPMPELRQGAANNRIALRAWLDTNQDCTADVEETLVATIGEACGVAPSPTPTNTLVPGQPTNTPTNTPTATPTGTPIIGGGPQPPEIPALGPSGLWLLVGMLALLGALMLWRRGN
jgi:hypothetical protein